MRIRLIPPDVDFFEILASLAGKVEEGAALLVELLEDFQDVEARAGRIGDIEHEGDELTSEILHRLNTTFVTPFHRKDILRLAKKLDDVLDHIEAAADLLHLHQIETVLPQLTQLTRTLSEAAALTSRSMTGLQDPRGMQEYWIAIHQLENDGDRQYRRTIAELFSGDHKAMDVLKYQDIVEEIEEAIDDLEQVANVIEGISLRNG